jgi:hypothetical protein
MGPPGEAGARGPVGPEGPAGPQGETGPMGSLAAIVVGYEIDVITGLDFLSGPVGVSGNTASVVTSVTPTGEIVDITGTTTDAVTSLTNYTGHFCGCWWTGDDWSCTTGCAPALIGTDQNHDTTTVHGQTDSTVLTNVSSSTGSVGVTGTTTSAVVQDINVAMETIFYTTWNVDVGQSVVIKGAGFEEGDEVTISICDDNYHWADVTANSCGAFEIDTTVPVDVDTGPVTVRAWLNASVVDDEVTSGELMAAWPLEVEGL